MINFEDIKKVIDDLEQYVSSLKTVTETQSELEKSSNVLQGIKKELDSLLSDFYNSIGETRKSEQFLNDVLTYGINSLNEKVSSLEQHYTNTGSILEKSNMELSEIKQKLDSLMTEIRNFADVAQQAEQMRNEILSANFTSIKDKISGIELQNNNRLNDLEKKLMGIEKTISKRNKALIFIILAVNIIIIGVTFWGKFM